MWAGRLPLVESCADISMQRSKPGHTSRGVHCHAFLRFEVRVTCVEAKYTCEEVVWHHSNL
jgi:hypothetical protein